MQDILQRFTRKPYTPSVNQITQLNDRLATISKFYFDELVEFETNILIGYKQVTDKDQSNISGRMDYLRLFRDALASRLREKYPECTGSNVAHFLLLKYFEKHKPSVENNTLESSLIIFSEKPGEQTKNYVMGVTLPGDIPTYVAYAVQNILTRAPHIRSTFRDYGITNDVGKCLEEHLRYIEKIRTSYGLPVPLDDLDSARRTLEVAIARANKTLWLPLKPLIMAPLSKADDLCFDVREKSEEENLARQIIKNDGVILVTGYRGVGKSTFVEATFARIPTLDVYQNAEAHREIVKIQINLAKSKTTFNVLRQCLRTVCNILVGKPVEFKEEKVKSSSLQQEKPLVELLTEDEKQFIKWAYLRVCYKVDLQKGENSSSLGHAETAMNVNPFAFIPKPFNTAGSLSFGLNVSKEWSNKVGRTIAILDYDEDQAEDDLIHIIEMLARPRKLRDGQIVSIKLAFIFDEMDKMDQDLQATMVEQLKTLFLTRNAVFLLVTSKEFHYLWLNEQKKEDAVLGSYFSSIILVPLFTAQITKKLLKKLIWMASDKDSFALLEPDEDKFVDTLAYYLTYRAKGLPRDIFRLMQEMLEWFPASLQPFLSNNPKQKIKIDMYAEIDRKLESFIGTSTDASSNMLTVAPELFWMDSQRRDHVQRGLYTFIEEVLSHTRLEIVDLNFAGKVPDNIRSSLSDALLLETIYKNNFQMVLPSQFNDLINKLCTALLDISLGNEKLFLLDDKSYEQVMNVGQVSGRVLKVSPAYYQVFGPPAAPAGDSHITTLTISQIERLLQEPDQISRIRALNSLSQHRQDDFTEKIQMFLYRIFLTEEEQYSLPAASLLNGRGFLEMAVKAETNDEVKELIHQFIAIRPDGPILLKCIDLIESALSSQSTSRAGPLPAPSVEKATSLLLELLARFGLNQEPQTKDLRDSVTEASSLRLAIRIITCLARDTSYDVLEDVLRNINSGGDISEELRPLLITLDKRSKTPAIALLIQYNFHSLSPATIDVFLDHLQSPDFPRLWSYAMRLRVNIELARKVMTAILRRWPRGSFDQEISAAMQELVLEWLNLPESGIKAEEDRWNFRDDHFILQEAIAVPDTILRDTLNTLISQPGNELAKARVNRAVGIASTGTATPATTPKRVKTRITLAIIAAVLIGAYFIVPLDLPANVSLGYHIVARLLELCYVILGVIGAVVLILGLFGGTVSSLIISGLVLVGLTIAALLGQIFFFPLVPTFLGQFGLIGLLVVAAILIIIDIGISVEL